MPVFAVLHEIRASGMMRHPRHRANLHSPVGNQLHHLLLSSLRYWSRLTSEPPNRGETEFP